MLDAALVRPAIAMLMLGGAAVSDLRTRRVPNVYWFPFVALAAVFLVSDLVVMRSHGVLDLPLLIAYAIALVICLVLYLMWRFRLFGGADAKGLMVLAFLTPFAFQGASSLAEPGSSVATAAPLALPPLFDTLLVAAVLNLVPSILFLVWNLAHGRVRLPAILLGVPMSLDRARRAHVWPVQDVVEGKTVWRYWPSGASSDERFDRLAKAGIDPVWTTAKLPMMVSLALGFLITWAWGDPLAWLMQRFGLM